MKLENKIKSEEKKSNPSTDRTTVQQTKTKEKINETEYTGTGQRKRRH